MHLSSEGLPIAGDDKYGDFERNKNLAKIGQAAVESMARQPEVAGQIQTAMIIAAALIEGVTLFALVVCLLSNGSYMPFKAG